MGCSQSTHAEDAAVVRPPARRRTMPVVPSPPTAATTTTDNHRLISTPSVAMERGERQPSRDETGRRAALSPTGQHQPSQPRGESADGGPAARPRTSPVVPDHPNPLSQPRTSDDVAEDVVADEEDPASPLATVGGPPASPPGIRAATRAGPLAFELPQPATVPTLASTNATNAVAAVAVHDDDDDADDEPRSVREGGAGDSHDDEGNGDLTNTRTGASPRPPQPPPRSNRARMGDAGASPLFLSIDVSAGTLSRPSLSPAQRRTSGGSSGGVIVPRIRTHLQHPMHLLVLSPTQALDRSIRSNRSNRGENAFDRSIRGGGGGSASGTALQLDASRSGRTPAMPSMGHSASFGASLDAVPADLTSENLGLHLRASSRQRRECEVYALGVPEHLQDPSGASGVHGWLDSLDAEY